MRANLQDLLNRRPRLAGLTFGSRNSKRCGGKTRSKNGLKSSVSPLAVVAVSAFIISIALLMLPVLTTTLASNPAAGTLSPAGPSVTWNGMAADYANPVSASEQNCQDGVNCDTFKLTVSGTTADWAGKSVHIQIDWLSPTFDYALSVHKGTNADPSIASSDNPVDAPRNWEAVDINPSVSGVGDYSVHIIYFTTSSLDAYKGTASIGTLTPASTPPPVFPSPPGSGNRQSHSRRAARE